MSAPARGSRVPAADLHLHTTASDGLDTPADLVRRARRAGITTISVTDHDTLSAIPDVQALAPAAGLGFVAGVEITAVWEGTDVHLLAYFVDPRSPRLSQFLSDQQADRLRRARLMAGRLSALGVPIEIDRLIERCGTGVVSRPVLARALVEAGHVPSVDSAFDRYLAEGQPAYVPRCGAAPAEVVQLARADGAFVSIAHPGVTGQDHLIPGLVESGLGAVEAYHPDHSQEDTARYLAMADEHGLAVSGGSDDHGEQTRDRDGFGRVGLSDEEFARFCARAGRDGAVRT